MCGIIGYLGDSIDEKTLSCMNHAIKHRGPDDQGVKLLGSESLKVGLGNARLSIIDLSPAGHQPMSSSDGKIWIVYNGEIYNFQEINEELKKKGYSFRSKSDTETVIYAYKEYGVKCLEKFNGMFAFAIWDDEKKQLFVARDRMGIKPLYYYSDGGSFWLSSEIKALFEDSRVKKEMNKDSLYDYLMFGYVAGEKTMFKGVKELLPGHYMTIGAGTGEKIKISIKIKKYWELKDYDDLSGLEENEACSLMEQKLSSAVRLQMLTDAPMGLMISGGVDSGIISYLAKKNLDKYGKKLGGIHVRFPGECYDELPHAKRIAEKIGAELHVVSATEDDLIRILEHLVWYYDEPIHDTTVVALYLICEKARQLGIKVLLCGDGSDELFAGYERYQEIAKKYEITKKDETIVLARNTISVPKIDRFYDGKKEVSEYRYKILESFSGKSILSKELLLDQMTFLQSYLHRQDKIGLSTSVEIRPPYLDHNFVNFANGLSDDLKIRGEEHKYLLKKLAKKLLPAENINRQKQPFNAPIGKSLREGKMQKYYDLLISNDSRILRYFKREPILAFIEENKLGQGSGDGITKTGEGDRNADHTRILWTLLALEMWMRKYDLH